jgi:MYXO-CTERM domain-containing protein
MLARMGAFARARALPRAVGVGTAAAIAVLLLATPALAHITITPASAPAGSTNVLTFHVPNEEAHADTTRVDIQIPTAHPIALLLVKPVLGWRISVRTVTLPKPIVTDDGQFTQAVSEVIWSGGKIPPGQFQDFAVSADSLPDGVSQLPFKSIQTYSNGDVVRWIDLQQPGQPEPDHPAPVLTLTTAAPARTAAATATSASSGSDGTARALAIVGLLAGLLALVVAGLRRRRRPAWPGGGGRAPGAGGHEDTPAAVRAMAAQPGTAAKSAAAKTAGQTAEVKTTAGQTTAAKTAGPKPGGPKTGATKTAAPAQRRRRR